MKDSNIKYTLTIKNDKTGEEKKHEIVNFLTNEDPFQSYKVNAPDGDNETTLTRKDFEEAIKLMEESITSEYGSAGADMIFGRFKCPE